MPKPKSMELCPQCGCTRTADVPTPKGSITFRCGESLKLVDKEPTASYTCYTIPARMQALEEALENAVNAIITIMPVSPSVTDALRRGLQSNLGRVPIKGMPAERLVMLGLLRNGPGHMVYTLTTLGRHYAIKIQEEDKKWTIL